MSAFFYLLWRFILASVAWLVAVIVAAFVITVLLFAAVKGPPDQNTVENLLKVSLVATPFTIIYVGAGTFVPSLFIIVWAEFAARRDWLFYSLAGLLMGVGIVGYNIVQNAQAGPSDYALFLTSAAVAGIIAGFVYWAIAGRSAGPRR
ncbi:hypothetical protein [Brucella sp. IR073]|uniref:hypothetical protein n=1 Tax=unclassified Brucella TaxID=2632610 RepID=UPI003B987C3D